MEIVKTSMSANFERMIEEVVAMRIGSAGASRAVAALTHMSSVFKVNSCGLTLLDDNEATVVYLVDNITEPTPCKLYMPQEYFPLKVALGLHGVCQRRRYAKVSIDSIKKRKYNRLLLDHPPKEDNRTLGDNIGTFVAWHKCYIQCVHDESSSDEEDNNCGHSSTAPRVSQPPPPMLLPPRRAPSTAPPPMLSLPMKVPSPMGPSPMPSLPGSFSYGPASYAVVA